MSKETMKTLQELENSLNQLANRCIEMGKETATAIAIEQLKQPIVFMFMKSLKENEANKKRIIELETVILKDYISKFIIRETIEELKAEYIKELDKNSIQAFILKCKIEGLEELLKDGGE